MTTDSVFVSISSVCQKKPPFTCASNGVLGGVQTFFFFFFFGRLPSDLSVLLLSFRESAPELPTSFPWQIVSDGSSVRRRFSVSFRCRLAWGAWLRFPVVPTRLETSRLYLI